MILVPSSNIWLPQNIISGCMKGRWYDSLFFIFYLWKWKFLSHVWLFATPWNSRWNSPGQNTGVGSHSLLQGIFPTQGSNPDLPHCRQILYQLSHQERPRILEWVAYPFSSRSSRPRNQTRVPCIAGGFFTSWATREVVRIMSWWPVSFCTTVITWVLTYQACFNSLLPSFLLSLKLCHV